MIIIMWVVLRLSKWNYNLDDAKIREQFENRKVNSFEKSRGPLCDSPGPAVRGNLPDGPGIIIFPDFLN